MTKLELITDHYPDEEFLSADGFEEAVIGVVYDKMDAVMRLAYSRCKCLEILMKRDGMTEEEAVEYFDFNVEGAYMGEKTPVWVDDTYAC
jgi:hypothetical protein